MPDALSKWERDVPCAGKCGASAKIVEPPIDRPFARAAAALFYAVHLTAKGWEWTAGEWFCRPCRVRKRLVKALPPS